MNFINQDLNNYDYTKNRVGFKADSASQAIFPTGLPITQNQQVDVQLPDMYYMPEHYSKPTSTKENIKKFDILGLVSQWIEHPILMLGTCAGISVGLDAFDKSCNKDYEQSIVGKSAKFGDKLEKSKAIQNENSQKVLKGIKKGWKSVKDFAMKSSIISAMVNTPSKPEWSMPKEELKHTDYRLVQRFRELSRDLGISPDDVPEDAVRKLKLKKLRLGDEEIEYLKKTYNVNKLTKVPETEGVYRINLRRIGKTESEIAEIFSRENPIKAASNELFNKMGATPEMWERIMTDTTGETLPYVKEYAKNMDGLWINKGTVILSTKHQPFANKEGFKGIYNRAHSLSEGAETRTGQFISKLVQKIHRGFTFGGAKLGVMLFVAPMLVETMLKTKKADKKEKVGTATQGVINSVSWVFTFPIVLKAIYALGGIQYAGMGKDNVEEYERLINEFNAKTNLDNPKHFKNISEYRAAKKDLKEQLKKLRRVENQSLFTKSLRGISRFGKADLLKIESFKNGNTAGDIARKLPNLIKDYAMYAPGRFLMFMAVGLPFADKIIEKCTSKIFGHAYDESKEEEVNSAKEKQEEYTFNDLKARMLEIQKNKMNPTQESLETSTDKQSSEPFTNNYVPGTMQKMAEQADSEIPNTNIAPMQQNDTQTSNFTSDATENTKPSGNIQNSVQTIPPEKESQNNVPEQLPLVQNINKKRDNYTYIPSQDNIFNNALQNGQINKYIPAQTGIQVNKVFDNSGVDAALKRASRAEQRALDVLAGNFGNIA